MMLCHNPIRHTLALLPTIVSLLNSPLLAQSLMQRVATITVKRSILSNEAEAFAHPPRPSHYFAKRTFAIMSSSSNENANAQLQYIDAGANLLDSMYQGTYHSKPRHEPDLDIVLQRAYDKGVHKIISLAGTIKESEELMDLIAGLDSDMAKQEKGDNSVQVFGTVGVHPTRCAEVFAEKDASSSNEGEEADATATKWIPKTEQQQNDIIQQLIDLSNKGKESGNIVAIGECGLDYARLHFCPKDVQKLGLRAQLEVACETTLPLYLHNRESGDDLYEILSEYKDKFSTAGSGLRGIVHSFDESIEIANQFLSLGLYIGINGCSLKTPENLEVVKQLPLSKLILETDCPWCDIRNTHASSEYIMTTFPTKREKQYNRDLGKEYCVKNRTEPCHIAQVAEVVAGVQGMDVEEVVKVCCQNVYDLFGSLEKDR